MFNFKKTLDSLKRFFRIDSILEVLPIRGGTIHIDRTLAFSLGEFMNEGWKLWRGPINGDGLIGETDTDNRSLSITEINLSKIQLISCVDKVDVGPITGEDVLARLKGTKYIRLDVAVFRAVLKNKNKIPEFWKERVNGKTRFIYFEDPLRNPYGNNARYILSLYWCNGAWQWRSEWLGGCRYLEDSSAVLVQ